MAYGNIDLAGRATREEISCLGDFVRMGSSCQATSNMAELTMVCSVPSNCCRNLSPLNDVTHDIKESVSAIDQQYPHSLKLRCLDSRDTNMAHGMVKRNTQACVFGVREGEGWGWEK